MATILLPLDGSPLAEQALPQAVSQLRQGDCLVLLRVIEPFYPELGVPPVPYFEPAPLHLNEERAVAYLAEQASVLHGLGFEVTEKLTVGVARDAILAAARQEAADLIVMTSHGYTGGKRWLLGSVAEAVAREAPCPVWLVRCTELAERREPRPLRKVLIPLDNSPHAERGLDFAVDWLRARPVQESLPELILYSAVGVAPSGEGWGPDPVARAELLESRRGYLQGLADRLGARGWNVRMEVEDMPAAAGILEAGQREEVDLIVVGSHGRTGLDRWFWGSVAEQVVRHAPCPTLLVNTRAEVPSALAP